MDGILSIGRTATCKAKWFIPVYRLGEVGDLKNEGGGMILVWAIRARSYKTRAEAWQQGQSPPYSPRGLSGFCLASRNRFKEFKSSRVQEDQPPSHP